MRVPFALLHATVAAAIAIAPCARATAAPDETAAEGSPESRADALSDEAVAKFEAGHPHRGRGPGACRPVGPRDQRLCHQRQGCLTARLEQTWFKPIESEKVKWLI